MKVYGVVGWKNAGKTTLVERLVGEIAGRGFSVSTVKHTHHKVDVDQKGKDSWRHRRAGARQVILASSARWAIMTELKGVSEAPLRELLGHLAPVDLADNLEEALSVGNMRKIIVWTSRHGCARAVFDEGTEFPFFNVNTPEDMVEAERILKEQA